MLAIIKVFIILFLLCLWEQGTPWQFSKQISKLSFQLSFQMYSLLGQTEGESKAFFGGCKKRGHIVRYPQEHLVVMRDEKVSPFVKFEIIQPLLCFLSDPLTNKHCRIWSPIINLCIHPQEHLVVMRDEKVSPFVKFEIIQPLLCFLSDPLTNKHCRIWSPIINLCIHSRICQK